MTVRLTRAELEERAAVSGADIARYAAAGAIEPGDDGTFDAGDVHRLRFIAAFEGSGVPIDVWADARRAGKVRLDRFDEFHPTPGPLSKRTIGELRGSLDADRAALLDRVLTALGLAVPADGERLPASDEAMAIEMVDAITRLGDVDLGLSVARLYGASARRTSEAALELYDQAAREVLGQVSGFADEAVAERLIDPWARMARLAPRLMAWLAERHLSDAIDGYSVTATEDYLVDQGYLDAREKAVPAIAFLDLSGFTGHTERHGDEAAASLGMTLAALADVVATEAGGRVVKLLGDGVLSRFPDAAAAVRATRTLLARLHEAGLPAGHAGVASGPVISRRGDVFGRTVNLAARLSDRAEAGEILVPAATAAELRASGLEPERIGQTELKGFAEPVEIWRLASA